MTKAMMDDPRRIREENPFESMMERFDRAAQLLNLNPDLYAVMRVPSRAMCWKAARNSGRQSG